MATAAKSMELDTTGNALRRQYEGDLRVEAAAYRAFAQAERELTLAQQRRRVSENAYRLHAMGVAA